MVVYLMSGEAGQLLEETDEPQRRRERRGESAEKTCLLISNLKSGIPDFRFPISNLKL
jgi:hypothetical protein